MDAYIKEARETRAHFQRMTHGKVTQEGFRNVTRNIMTKSYESFARAFAGASTEERKLFVELIDDAYFHSVPIQNFIADLFVIKFRALKMANCTGEGNDKAMEFWRDEKRVMLKDKDLQAALANATEYDIGQWNNMCEDPVFLS